MIEEVLPGLVQWNAFHEGIGHVVYSSFVLDSGTLIDPMEPEEGLEAVAALAIPQRIVLTNRHHYRHSASYTKHFGCPVLCHKTALGHFAEDSPVQGFSFDEQLAEGVLALELGSICVEETTLLMDVEDGVLSFGDGLTREQDGSLAFMPDTLLGDDPQRVRAGLLRNLRRMLDEDFDALLFAHSEPVLSGGRALLSDFLSHEA
jgi:glyoxylase-like metal-dependent hydrolase (beta-lactamase superfamily II)